MDEDEPGVEAWQAETTPCERIRAFTAATPHPESVRDVAETTGVEETVVGECLEDLVEEGVLVRRYSDEDEEVLYELNEFYTEQETVQDLAGEHSHEDLVDLERELEAKIESWRDEYSVDGPDELRDKAGTTRVEETREQIRVVADWKL